MNYEVEINKLWYTLNCLQEAFIQSQRNQVPVTGKVDDTSNRVDSLTPYTATKEAYYGDTSVTFYDAPEGRVSVYINDYLKDYSVSRIENRLVVSFDALDKQTTVTITIQ